MRAQTTGRLSVSPMRLSRAYLVVVDISGYTRFITERSLTLSHAEQIITDLIEAVLVQARHPMTLNKLEGDAAMLFRELPVDDVAQARDVFAQVRAFFEAFRRKLAEIRDERRHCSCDACRNIVDLGLKAFVHVGDIAIKQVRQFEELAGEPVILLHRMMKNHVLQREYVLATEEATTLAQLPRESMHTHVESLDGFGSHSLLLFDPQDLPEATPGAHDSPAPREHAERVRRFRNLPVAEIGILRRASDLFDRLFGRRG